MATAGDQAANQAYSRPLPKALPVQKRTGMLLAYRIVQRPVPRYRETKKPDTPA